MNIGCQNCGAALVVDDAERTTKCPYCASPQIVSRPPTRDRPAPVFTIPFALAEGPAKERVRGWLKTRGFFRDPLLKTASIADMRGVYVPAYLYAAVAHSMYAASIGEKYVETEEYTVTDSEGRKQTRTRQVTKIEWRDLNGAHASYVMDVLVTASRGLSNAELEAIEPFDLRQMRRHDDALVSGWIAEEATLSLERCVELARSEALAKVGHALTRFMPGDTYEDLRYETSLEQETADPMLVPVWVLAAMRGPKKPPVRVVVNGQSGAIHGVAPISVPRVVAAIVFGLALIALLVLRSTHGGGR